ncbi:hypothetical protein G6F65_022763 [Rhizopus arrhizus]|nr:hypothetical protein G6F65_022763 [Rhizopus arrhizus]
MTAGRDLDYSALDYDVLRRDGPQQWPYRPGQGTARLYADGVFSTPSGRARFCDVDYLPPADAVTPAFPLQTLGVAASGRHAAVVAGVRRAGAAAFPARQRGAAGEGGR